ncbi:MAG: hypothetical protein IJ555_07125, partial [Ruminococcus sp.]|nr:hypothetical protein [Ruminococcus sp.]
GSLDDTSKSAIMLFYYEERTLADCANVLGITENAAKQRLFKARQKIKKALTKLYGQTALCAVPLGAVLDEPTVAAEVVKPAVVSTGLGLKIAAVSAMVLVGVAVPVGIYLSSHHGGIGEDKSHSISVSDSTPVIIPDTPSDTEPDLTPASPQTLDTSKLIYCAQAMPAVSWLGRLSYIFMFIDESGQAFYAEYNCEDIKISEEDIEFFKKLSSSSAETADSLSNVQYIGTLSEDELAEINYLRGGIAPGAEFTTPDMLPDVEETMYFTDNVFLQQDGSAYMRMISTSGLNKGNTGELDDRNAQTLYHGVHTYDIYKSWKSMIFGTSDMIDNDMAAQAEMTFVYKGEDIDVDKTKVLKLINERLSGDDIKMTAENTIFTDNDVEDAKRDGLCVRFTFTDEPVKLGDFEEVSYITILSTDGIKYPRFAVNGSSVMGFGSKAAQELLSLAGITSDVSARFEIGEINTDDTNGTGTCLAINPDYGLVTFGITDDESFAHAKAGDYVDIEWSGYVLETYPGQLQDVNVGEVTFNDNDFVKANLDTLKESCKDAKTPEDIESKVDKLDGISVREKEILVYLLQQELDIV